MISLNVFQLRKKLMTSLKGTRKFSRGSSSIFSNGFQDDRTEAQKSVKVYFNGNITSVMSCSTEIVCNLDVSWKNHISLISNLDNEYAVWHPTLWATTWKLQYSGYHWSSATQRVASGRLCVVGNFWLLSGMRWSYYGVLSSEISIPCRR